MLIGKLHNNTLYGLSERGSDSPDLVGHMADGHFWFLWHETSIFIPLIRMPICHRFVVLGQGVLLPQVKNRRTVAI